MIKQRSFKIIEPLSEGPLPISLDEVKDHLRMSHSTSEEDAQISKYIRASVSLLSGYAGFPLYTKKEFVAYFDDFKPERYTEIITTRDIRKAREDEVLRVQMPHMIESDIKVWGVSSGTIWTEVPSSEYVVDVNKSQTLIAPKQTWPFYDWSIYCHVNSYSLKRF